MEKSRAVHTIVNAARLAADGPEELNFYKHLYFPFVSRENTSFRLNQCADGPREIILAMCRENGFAGMDGDATCFASVWHYFDYFSAMHEYAIFQESKGTAASVVHRWRAAVKDHAGDDGN